MQNFSPTPTFRRGAVQPVVCIQTGWELIKQRFWFFVGMSALAVIIGSMVPFGILLGPLTCGIYLTLFHLRRNQPIEFGLLFKGFDYFGDSVVATLIHYVPLVVVILPFYVVLYAGMFLMMPRQGGEPDPASLFGFLALLIVMMLVIFTLAMVVSIIFTFSYPLIVDRKMSGVDAVRASAKAAIANFVPLLGLSLLNGILMFIGVLLCYVGMFLAMPIYFAAIETAYEQVFGLAEAQAPNLPPPPPMFT